MNPVSIPNRGVTMAPTIVIIGVRATSVLITSVLAAVSRLNRIQSDGHCLLPEWPG